MEKMMTTAAIIIGLTMQVAVLWYLHRLCYLVKNLLDTFVTFQQNENDESKAGVIYELPADHETIAHLRN